MVLLFAMEDDGGDSFVHSGDGVRSQSQQTDQVDPYTAIVKEVMRRYNDPAFRSSSDADYTAATYSDYIYVFDDDRRKISRHRRPTFPAAADDYAVEYDEYGGEYEVHPFPVQAAAASEAAIAALEAAPAPADDCCPVCLQEGDGAAGVAWRRVAPCGHRFHAACVAQWLRVKLSCPVCRRPTRRDDMVEEMMLASEDDEPRGGVLGRVRQRNSARWAQFMATYNAHTTDI